MKKAIRTIIIATFLITSPLFMLAQNPPHPNGGSEPGTGNVPVGGGAPLGGGLVMLIAMGTAYGVKKAWNFRKED